MAEQTSSELRPKTSLLKTAVRKFAPPIIAAITALTLRAAHAPTTTIDQTPPIPASEQKEKQLFSSSVTIIDACPTQPTEGIIQKEFPPSNDELVKKLLGDKAISKQQQAMLHKFIDTYLSHGQDVAKVMEGTFGKSGLKTNGIECIPLQNIFDYGDVTSITDELGNPGISIHFDPKKIIELLKNNPSRVINMSFQVGNMEMLHEDRFLSVPSPKSIYGDGVNNAISDDDGNVYIGAVNYGIVDGKTVPVDAYGKKVKPTTPEEQDVLRQKAEEEAQKNAKIVEGGIHTKIVGAYDKSKALENLPRLFEVAKAYPDRLFFAAAGNEGEDLREALVTLGSGRPSNLILVAQSGWNGPTGNVYGADLYVDNASLGLLDGSSFSTSVLTGSAGVIFDRGTPLEQVKEKILVASESKSYTRGGRGENKEEVRVFDPQKLN